MKADAVQALAARFEKAGGKRITLTDETALMVTHALRFYADVVSSPSDHGNYRVEVWTANHQIVECMARTTGILTGRAAFAQACLERPNDRVTLRQGIRVIQNKPAVPPKTIAEP